MSAIWLIQYCSAKSRTTFTSSKYSILYLTNHTNRSAHKDYFSNPKGVTWEAVLNVQDWPTVPPTPPPP